MSTERVKLLFIPVDVVSYLRRNLGDMNHPGDMDHACFAVSKVTRKLESVLLFRNRNI